MINLKVNDADRILIVEMKGMITEADIDGAIDALQEQYPAVGVHLRGGERGFNILADWQDLQGWEKGAKTLGTLTTKTIGDAVRKVAVIASAAFADEEPRLADVTKQAVVRFFPPGGRDDALPGCAADNADNARQWSSAAGLADLFAVFGVASRSKPDELGDDC